ncbi:MAG: AMP-binding protein, partial [Kangiella sp.]|nr:AMP-binding protein [Kangiella sp.]
HFHRDVMAMADTFSRHILQPGQDDVFAGTPPLAFTFGLGAVLVFPFHARASTVLDETAGPGELLQTIEHFKVTALFTAPTAYRAMLGELCQADAPDLSALRLCVSAGEALPKATSDAWFDQTGIRLIDGIGATELIHIFISAAGNDIRPGSTGKPVPGYQACVLDASGEPAATGEVGRLAVKGPTGCKYMNDARQADYVQNGWNITGDSYRIDEEGYFWFVARSDDMIISGGYNISGPEVENALLTHPSVEECAVVGTPDQDRGQLVTAFVVAKPGMAANADLITDLQNHVKATVAPYIYPRNVVFLDSLPKTQTGKIKRFELRTPIARGTET